MTIQVSPNNFFLTVEQVAARYAVSKDSIWRWKREGRFPGRCCRRAELDTLAAFRPDRA